MPHRARLLVVEDNPKVARFLVRALSEEGYAVELAPDGDVALDRATAVGFDVVILDWMLPTKDGPTVCRDLRARGSTVPVLMLTARGEVGDRITGLDAGADDYLPKPFELGELLARIRALVRRRAPGMVLSLGGLVIDRAERRVTLEGERVDLTPREFSLLSYLAREAGRAVPRAELLEKVWEITFDPGTNVLDVHVRRLREKLGAHARYLETVRGVGYRLVAP